MKKEVVFFDNGATTYVNERFKAECAKYLDMFGNPSSLYYEGNIAKTEIEEVRKKLAYKMFAEPNQIVFTSGGTESINTAIYSSAIWGRRNGRKKIIVSTIEHKATLKACELLEELGFTIEKVSVDKYGFVNLRELETMVDEQTALVSIMWVNNETGAIQPVQEIGEIAHRNGALFHTDAVAAVGNVPIAITDKIDFLSFSGHKIGALKGVGVLYVVDEKYYTPLIMGGMQNNGKRAGTENTLGIISLGYAIDEVSDMAIRKKAVLNYRLCQELEKIPEVTILAPTRNTNLRYSSSVVNFNVRGIPADTLLVFFNLNNIAVSTGSACNENETSHSHVLTAMGVPEELISSIRVTIGFCNDIEDVDYFIKKLKEIIGGQQNVVANEK